MKNILDLVYLSASTVSDIFNVRGQHKMVSIWRLYRKANGSERVSGSLKLSLHGLQRFYIVGTKVLRWTYISAFREGSYSGGATAEVWYIYKRRIKILRTYFN